MRCISFVCTMGAKQISGLIIYKPFMSWDIQTSKQRLRKCNCINYFMLFDVFTRGTLSLKACCFPIYDISKCVESYFFKVCMCMCFYQEWTLGFISSLMDSSSPYLHQCLKYVCWSHLTLLTLCRCCLWTDGVHPSGFNVDLC